MMPGFSPQNPLSGPLVRESVVDSANCLHYASILIERTFCYHGDCNESWGGKGEMNCAALPPVEDSKSRRDANVYG